VKAPPAVWFNLPEIQKKPVDLSDNPPVPEVVHYPFECLDPNGRWGRVPSQRRACRFAKDCPVGYEQIMGKISRINSGHDDYPEPDKRELLEYLDHQPDEWKHSYCQTQSGLPGSIGGAILQKLRDAESQLSQLVADPCHWVPPLYYARYLHFKDKAEQLQRFVSHPQCGLLDKDLKLKKSLNAVPSAYSPLPEP
jgi:hypothetical protein